MSVNYTGDAATTRTNLGLGDAATKTTGTSAGNIPVLDGSGNMPAVDGSALTGIEALPSGGTVGQVVTNTASGTGTWQDAAVIAPVAKAANYTAVDGDSLIITAGSITITLPASPTAGDTVVVKDGTGAAATTNWTVARNGSNIASSAANLTFDKNWAEITMTYVNATVGWSV